MEEAAPSVMIECAGVVVTDVNGVPSCQDVNGNPLPWTFLQEFDVSDLDPLLMSGAWTAGFVIVATGWAIGFGFRAVLSMLRR